MRLSVIGLGKLGSPMAAVLADKGHDVVGVDVNAGFVQALNEGRPPVRETGLAELITKNRARLRATTSFDDAVLGSEMTFIIVPTPSQKDGTFSLQFTLDACRKIGAALCRKSEFHVVVITSTVMPGATGGEIRQCLEQASGKVCGKDFGLCYNPEFIALGSVIRDMTHPDFILIGESDPRSGEMLAGLYERYWDPKPPVRRMSFVNAELSKISVNTFVTTKITYANMLARLCEKLPGADCDVVTQAIGCDSRIGHKYLKGALGFGGPCFPRDNVAFNSLARELGVKAFLAEATDRFNRQQVDWIADEIASRVPTDGRVAVLGLSYKPCTGVVEESQGIAIAQRLLAKGLLVSVYDPEALDNARPLLGDAVRVAGSMAECVKQADLVLVATPWEEFKRLSPNDLRKGGRKPIVVDCWRILAGRELADAAEIVVMGVGPQA